MSLDPNKDLIARVGQLEEKVSRLYKKIDLMQSTKATEGSGAERSTAQRTSPLNIPKTPLKPNAPIKTNTVFAASTPSPTMSAGSFLGYAGVGCLVLAIILLVRLSIDSGWLTPSRQLIMAAMFGFSLIGLPFMARFKDLDYMSQLPAVGIVVLNLVVMGGVFHHKIIDPTTAILFVSAISMFAMILMLTFEYEKYAVVSIAGTYIGALCLKHGFPSKLIFISFIMVWNIIYCIFAISLRKRQIILLVSYLAIGLVSLKAIGIGSNPEVYLRLAIVQAIQFILFFGAVVLYSVKTREVLNRAEAWSFFPLLLFFYLLEYHLLDKYDPSYATVMVLVFSISLLAVFKGIKIKTKEEKLVSEEIVYTSVAAIFAHGIFLSCFSELYQLVFGLSLVVSAAFFKDQIKNNESLKGANLIGVFMFGYCILLLFTGPKAVSPMALAVFGALYGAGALGAYALSAFKKGAKKEITLQNEFALLLLAHSQFIFAIYRLKEFVGRSMIAPLWIAYAFVLFVWALNGNRVDIAKSAMPVVFLALIRFLIRDFNRLGGGERVVSLLVMGGLIFAAGYTYQKIIRQQALKS